MSNNTIANDLIYGKSTTAGNGEFSGTTGGAITGNPQESKDDEVVMENTRVISAKYKIYFITFLLAGLLIFYKMILPARDSRKNIGEKYASVKQEVENFQNRKKVAEDNVKLLKTLKEKETEFIQCINEQSDCKGLRILFTGDKKNIIKSYLNLTSLANKKMVIDEKKILENLNDFLLRKTLDRAEYNGEIEAIHIGEEDKFDSIIYYSPVDLRIVFDNKDDLLSFVDNIESRILPKQETRILYQIDNIKYDILKSQEKQSVNLALYMFYTR